MKSLKKRLKGLISIRRKNLKWFYRYEETSREAVLEGGKRAKKQLQPLLCSILCISKFSAYKFKGKRQVENGSEMS